MKLTIGYSPCPNDTFIFDAMVHHKIDTEGLDFEVKLADVEELNQLAFAETLQITKLSYHAFAYITDKYLLLDSGSALGNGVGPLLICKKPTDEIKPQLLTNPESVKIAIPGKYTTANFLLSLAFPKATQKTEVLFSDIEAGVLNGTYDAGLIIHENRFTYAERGLNKIIDLGDFWEQLTQAPIPLGGIVVSKKLIPELQQKINRVLRKSIEYAFENPDASYNYVKQHAQEMSEEVRKKHIHLYVNKYSLSLGNEGRNAIKALFNKAQELKIVPKINEPYIIDIA